jgi:hypothetical protein
MPQQARQFTRAMKIQDLVFETFEIFSERIVRSRSSPELVGALEAIRTEGGKDHSAAQAECLR